VKKRTNETDKVELGNLVVLLARVAQCRIPLEIIETLLARKVSRAVYELGLQSAFIIWRNLCTAIQVRYLDMAAVCYRYASVDRFEPPNTLAGSNENKSLTRLAVSHHEAFSSVPPSFFWSLYVVNDERGELRVRSQYEQAEAYAQTVQLHYLS